MDGYLVYPNPARFLQTNDIQVWSDSQSHAGLDNIRYAV